MRHGSLVKQIPWSGNRKMVDDVSLLTQSLYSSSYNYDYYTTVPIFAIG